MTAIKKKKLINEKWINILINYYNIGTSVIMQIKEAFVYYDYFTISSYLGTVDNAKLYVALLT